MTIAFFTGIYVVIAVTVIQNIFNKLSVFFMSDVEKDQVFFFPYMKMFE